MTERFGQRRADEMINDTFSGYDSSGGTTVVATPVTVTLDAEHLPSSADFSLASNEVTVSGAGDFDITMTWSCMVTTNARTQGQAWLERNGVEVPGTRVLNYCRQANHGATGTAEISLALADGDVLRIRAQRTAGGGTLSCLADGSRLKIRRL